MNYLSTICAISTAPGLGGIAVIRISGKDAIAVSDAILEKPFLTQKKPNTVFFTRIVNEKKEIVDEVLVTLFRAPHSFTGEDVVEISCHGSLFVQQEILRLLLKSGAEMASPGEFTQRAFLNGKMDLSQAEAVGDLIASSSAAAHRIAIQQMRGVFSQELAKLRDDLLTFVSLIELELDFSEEDVQFADRTQLNGLVDKIVAKLTQLSDSFTVGNAIKNGIPVAIVGETNVGKSTLLNLLLNEERAIVSDIHGTTRDSIEDTVVIQGITFRFIDTAGIRATHDVIENIGIERTFQKIAQAEIVILLADAIQGKEAIQQQINQLKEALKEKCLVLVCNKSDKLTESEKLALQQTKFNGVQNVVCIAAKYGENTNQLQQILVEHSHVKELTSEDVIVSNARHYEALNKSLNAIQRVKQGLNNNVASDFLSQDIRECMYYLGEITGSIGTEEILGTIFSRFCVGK